MEGLNANDFVVLSDGQPQAVRMLARDYATLPIHAVVVLQTNDASAAALAKIKKTASVVSTYITNDMGLSTPSLAAVVAVSDEVQVVQEFTTNVDVLGDVFGKLKASGGAGRILDGVSLACDLLTARREPARRIIVLIAESRDRQSKSHFADVVTKLQRTDAVLYSLSYSAYTTAFTQRASERQPPDEIGSYDPHNQGGIPLLAIPMELARLGKVNAAQALARASGGGHERFTTLKFLERDLMEVGTEIHNRYTLTFVPPEQQALGYHALEVSLRQPRDFHIHARAGYWTSAEPQ